jgi:hypothetical protein
LERRSPCDSLCSLTIRSNRLDIVGLSIFLSGINSSQSISPFPLPAMSVPRRLSTSARPTLDTDQPQHKHRLQQQQHREIMEEECEDDDIFTVLSPAANDHEHRSASQSPQANSSSPTLSAPVLVSSTPPALFKNPLEPHHFHCSKSGDGERQSPLFQLVVSSTHKINS